MKTVQSYQTSDGKLFTNVSEAQAHQKELGYTASLNSFIDKYTFYEVSDWFRNMDDVEGKALFETLKLKYG